ncbi:proteasome complex subunit Rpn13 ubiquitin receptor-domain-containing protein [Dipodascopsis uninucleata]
MAETATAQPLTFKAGRVDFNPPSKRLTPLPYKGKITLSRPTDEDPSLVSFVWEPRGSSKGNPDLEKDELMIFPGEAEWLPVSQCETGRVYVLKFNSSSQRIFFWMQDAPASDELNKLTETDLEISKKVNALLEDTFVNDEDESATNQDNTAIATGDVEMTDSSAPDQAAQGLNITSLLRSIVVPPAGDNPTSSSGTPIVNLVDVITPARMIAYVNSLDRSSPKLDGLYEFLPEGIPHTKPELLRVIQSPQFLQGLNSLSQTLRSSEGSNVGQLVSNELGFPYRGEGIEGFLLGIRAAIEEEQSENNQQSQENDDMQE